jgi:cysteinyl-tRNA synthetase
VLRLALLSGHYRQPLPWTQNLVAQSKATLDGLYRAAGDAEAGEVDAGVIEALSDDLNSPLAMARLGALGDAGSVKASAQRLGLLTMSADEWFRGGDGGDVQARIDARAEAKARRDFAEADRIRAELADEGVLLEDGASATTWRRA